jgi:hypothetical protein
MDLRSCCSERQRAATVVLTGFVRFTPSATPGEVLSVRQMIARMLQDHDIARRRVSRRDLPPAAASTFVAALRVHHREHGRPSGRRYLSLRVEVNLAPGWAAHELTIETTLALLGVVSERITLDRPCAAGVWLLTKPHYASPYLSIQTSSIRQLL